MRYLYPRWESVLWLTISLCGGLVACSGKPKPQSLSFDERSIQQVEIHYEHSGWDTVNEEFTIRPLPQGGFQIKGFLGSGGKAPSVIDARIQEADFRKFLGAVDAPAWSRREGIHEIAKTVSTRRLLVFKPVTRSPASECGTEEILAAARAEVAREGVEGIVDASYGDGMRWTDDYPFVVVQIVFRNGPPIVMSSNSQMALMLPWHTGVPAGRPVESLKQSWSVPFSGSLQALLPPESRLFQRLDGIERMNQRLRGNLERSAERACSSAKEHQRSRASG
ncbi:hypothetical protein OCJ37_18375 [Xanthomonas sp. AM6]|uniref:hypothetical protein n=1 Tax=Xanthomonas sp. AM6 TaxID=2982531 RepID=UPI0021D8E09B|nr:hypothetical protein [Xanthomonas sp. AM6]UYB51913.1 hypothetical protein OCJ37_18375 [Xanthomonas sp. AM6]